MIATWQEFSLSDIDKDYDYNIKFQDGHIETWYGEELLYASESQGAIFIFNITDMKKLKKPSKKDIKERIKESNEFKRTLKWAVEHSIERQNDIIKKANLNIKNIRNLSKEQIQNRFRKERNKFPKYKVELNFIEALIIKDIK